MKGFVSYWDKGQFRAAYQHAGRLVDLQWACALFLGKELRSNEIPCDLPGLLAIGEGAKTLLTAVDHVQGAYSLSKSSEVAGPSPFLEMEGVHLGPAVTRPGKIICVGMNYPGGGSTVASQHPTLFLKAESTLTGPGSPIVYPKITKKVFCEGELALVIDRRGKNIPLQEAWSFVAGLTIANDIGSEDLEARTSQWQTGKLPDTFLPLGPLVVPIQDIQNPDALEITVWVNDRLSLQGNTASMFFSPPTLIHYISQLTTLNPGDLIVTGSPKGIGERSSGKAYLSPGDTVRIQISEIGELVNPVQMEELNYG